MFRSTSCYYLVLIVLIGYFGTAKPAYLRCYQGNLTRYTQTPLDRPLGILNGTCIDRSLPTVVYTFGYRGKVAGPATTAVLTAYLATKKRNVLLVDWEDEAKSGLLGIPLGYALSAVPNSKKIGEQLGLSLVRLAKVGLNMTRVHLVGHSLGAHLLGFAGRAARRGGFVVPRITGLDPARALFEGSLALESGLDRKCAKFVDIIHTDPGGYGTSRSAGSVDFWPNYGGSAALQPGCPAGDFEMFSAKDLCSHDRSWQLLVASISAPASLPAREAADYADWLARSEAGADSRIIYMGEITNVNALGNYFLTTNSEPPYGRGTLGTVPDTNSVRSKRKQPSRSTSISRLLKYLR